MNPKTGISIRRTRNDTDPIILDLKVQNGGNLSKIPYTATVKFNMKIANSVISVVGEPAEANTDGLFEFDISSANTGSLKIIKFEVEVNADYDYIIGRGDLFLSDNLS